jgi:hypothetical protein
MKMRPPPRLLVCAPLVLALAATTAEARPDYVRSSNWVAGTTQGGTQGNPGPVGGTPVWQYETTQGGALGAANAWYKQTSELMTWDSAWYGTGWGVWSKGNDANPPILPSRLVHNVAASVHGDVPMVRFRNPLGNGAAININGSFQIAWNGIDGLGRPNDVDVVIAKFSAALNDTTLLFSSTVSKPLPFPSVGDSINIPINLSGITLDDGDSIVISHRGRTPLAPLGAWINLYDNVTVSAIPAPGSFGLLGAAGILAFRRRRA